MIGCPCISSVHFPLSVSSFVIENDTVMQMEKVSLALNTNYSISLQHDTEKGCINV